MKIKNWPKQNKAKIWKKTDQRKVGNCLWWRASVECGWRKRVLGFGISKIMQGYFWPFINIPSLSLFSSQNCVLFLGLELWRVWHSQIYTLSHMTTSFSNMLLKGIAARSLSRPVRSSNFNFYAILIVTSLFLASSHSKLHALLNPAQWVWFVFLSLFFSPCEFS